MAYVALVPFVYTIATSLSYWLNLHSQMEMQLIGSG